MFSLLSLLPFAISAVATGVLLPLYVYPGNNGAAWAPVTSAIAAYPSVQWQIIINPSSGPGTTAASPYPDANYIAGIEALKSYSNVVTLGYVDTSMARRAYSAVTNDINSYANWASYFNGNIGIDGIFFDDVPSIYDFSAHAGTQAPNETYYKNASSYAYATIPTSSTYVVFNTGIQGASNFYKYCDTMVEYEDTYKSYNGQTTLNSIKSNGGVLAQSAIIVHNTPATLSASSVNSVIHTMRTNNVNFVYLSNDCCYNVLGPTLLKEVASACNSA